MGMEEDEEEDEVEEGEEGVLKWGLAATKVYSRPAAGHILGPPDAPGDESSGEGWRSQSRAELESDSGSEEG